MLEWSNKTKCMTIPVFLLVSISYKKIMIKYSILKACYIRIQPYQYHDMLSFCPILENFNGIKIS